jgi:hypothetical protein
MAQNKQRNVLRGRGHSKKTAPPVANEEAPVEAPTPTHNKRGRPSKAADFSHVVYSSRVNKRRSSVRVCKAATSFPVPADDVANMARPTRGERPSFRFLELPAGM